MFVDLKDGDNTVYTHTSLVDEEKQAQINKIYQQAPSWNNGAKFLSLWGSLEAITRINAVSKLPLLYKAGFVAVPTLLGGFVGEFVYWNLTGSRN